LTFSLKYLVNFCKASGLDERVKLCLSNEVPLLVEYGLSGQNSAGSYLRFYLAPKVSLMVVVDVGSVVLIRIRRLVMKSKKRFKHDGKCEDTRSRQ